MTLLIAIAIPFSCNHILLSAPIENFHLPSYYDVDGLLLFRKWEQCSSVHGGYRCVETISIGGFPIEERVLLYDQTGVWIFAEINPVTKITELFEPPVPLLIHDVNAIYRGTVQRIGPYGEHLATTYWTADVLHRAGEKLQIGDRTIDAERREVYLRFLDRRLLQINLWVDHEGQLIKMTRKRIHDDVVVENTTWIINQPIDGGDKD